MGARPINTFRTVRPAFPENALKPTGWTEMQSGLRRPLLTTADVATWMGVARRTIRLWAELDELPALKLGRQWRFREEDIRRWIAMHIGERLQYVSTKPHL